MSDDLCLVIIVSIFPHESVCVTNSLVDGVDYELIFQTLCTRFDLLVISFIYTMGHRNPWVSAGVHTLAKKSYFSSLFGSHPPDYKIVMN